MKPNQVYNLLKEKIVWLELAPESALNISELAESVHDHSGAADLAKCTDMRQTGWAIAGFKQDVAFLGCFDFTFTQGKQPLEDGLGFLERPGFAGVGYIAINCSHLCMDSRAELLGQLFLLERLCWRAI